MKRIVVYKSSTGFTEKYARWIAEEIGCEAKPIKKVKQDELAGYDQVIFGGNIMGSNIMGYPDICKMNWKNLVLFAVGFSERTEETINNIRNQNQLGDRKFYYFRGGVNYEKMFFLFRGMLKSITKQTTSIDCSNKDDIKELIDALQQ